MGMNKDDLAGLLGITPGEVDALRRTGVIGKPGPDGYTLAAVKAYCAFLRLQNDIQARVVPTAEMADWLSVTPRIALKLAQDGVLEKSGEGQFKFAASIKNFIRYKHDSVRASSMDSRDEVNRETARKLRLQNAENEKRLIDVTLVENFFMGLFARLRAEIMNRSSRHSNEIASMDSPAEIREKLRRADMETLETLAADVDRFAAEFLTPIEGLGNNDERV
jgi:hypothetical protein